MFYIIHSSNSNILFWYIIIEKYWNNLLYHNVFSSWSKKNLLMYVPTYRECCARYSAYMILLFHTIFHPVINYLVHFFCFSSTSQKKSCQSLHKQQPPRQSIQIRTVRSHQLFLLCLIGLSWFLCHPTWAEQHVLYSKVFDSLNSIRFCRQLHVSLSVQGKESAMVIDQLLHHMSGMYPQGQLV